MTSLRTMRDRAPLVATGWLLITAGAVLGAIQVAVFMVPADVVPGGVSSLAVILNRVAGTPVGVMVLIANIPIQVLGYRMLGGWRLVVMTVYVVVVYSVTVDVITLVDVEPVSHDRLLNALFGGALGGIAGGLVYRGGGTFGGTSTLARIWQNRTGTPMSTTFLYTDSVLIMLAGVVFGWESVLYSVVALVVGGIVTDYVMEGPSVIRTLVIITDHPRDVADMVIRDMNRTVTAWDARGMYTEQARSVLYVTVPRSEATELVQMVLAVDPHAFVVIGQGHTAYGEGFKHVRPRARPGPEKPADQPPPD